uniref:CB1 cannabinoid receptor-interacting protein 1b n=1 Tax=Doryrhamphus excisus TaxID=161450 RepID=UPI0025AEB954|nr:CB1 cannabinoid receptor-interacting protein 1b [Doryrhamphus excisus]
MDEKERDQWLWNGIRPVHRIRERSSPGCARTTPSLRADRRPPETVRSRSAHPQSRVWIRTAVFIGVDMADVPQLVKIGISLKMLPSNTAVYFKSDGARFGQSRTIKLLTGSKYKIEVVVKPGAVEATSMTIGGVTFILEQQSKDPQSVVYTGLYNTEGVTHTKSGERQPVQIDIQFTEAGMFETVWQVKYYNYNKRDHCQWGNSFNSIEYECKPNDTRTLMWVNKETFM